MERSPDEGILVFVFEEMQENLATSGSANDSRSHNSRRWLELGVRVEIENFPSGSLRGCHSLTSGGPHLPISARTKMKRWNVMVFENVLPGDGTSRN